MERIINIASPWSLELQDFLSGIQYTETLGYVLLIADAILSALFTEMLFKGDQIDKNDKLRRPRGIVVEKGRGKEDREHRICVYINKAENGMLHILNETDCEETVLQRVKECLEQEPISEESGITIWTLNSYIKKIKVAYAERVLSKMTGGNINKISEILNRLTSEEFEIKVVIREVDHTRYFLYELPVLRQQYMQLENDGVI